MLHVMGYEVNVVRKAIKNIHLGVYPPNGRVRVAAPQNTEDEAIRMLIITRLSWIKKQQAKFLHQQRQSQREYVSGESHYLFGKRYLLKVIADQSRPRIEIKSNKYIELYVNNQTNYEKKEQLFEDYYRTELRKCLLDLKVKWEKKLKLTINELYIKKMKTKWGTCNPDKKRIWINLELAKKPIPCIEYIFVHELMHFFEKKHNENFRKLITRYYPNWKQIQNDLNDIILSYCNWG